MDILAAYASDSDDEKHLLSSATTATVRQHQQQQPSSPASAASLPQSAFVSVASFNHSTSLVTIDPSPSVSSSAPQRFIPATARVIYHNPPSAELYQPIVGPSPPPSSSSSAPLGFGPNHVLGYVEQTAMRETTFDSAYHSFIAKGFTLDPGQSELNHERIVVDSRGRGRKREAAETKAGEAAAGQEEEQVEAAEALKQKRRLHSDPADVESYLGPWLPREAAPAVSAPTAEQLRIREEVQLRRQKQVRDEHNNVVTPESSELLIPSAVDYQGRSFVSSPPELRRVDWTAESNAGCFLPKKLLHSWSGHTKGVSAIRFFPFSCHLLLSASMDRTLRLWRVGGDYRCLRSYSGHGEAVRDASFSHDGLHFLSVSYDKYVKLWDTETGQCVSRHSTGKTPFCGRLHPLPVHAHDALVGQQDRLIVQWDLRANQVAVEYNEHLDTVNSVTFIDEHRRFVSTSDDKKLLVWEYGLPVVVKHIAEPTLHSIPAVSLHPSGRYFLGQSMDNQILIFTASGRYKLKRDKRFVGHQVAGYACEVSVSPDGRWVTSGDGQGRMWCWDWKTGRVVKKMQCHQQVCIGCVWNDNETSKVATCSWDGSIKYWE